MLPPGIFSTQGLNTLLLEVLSVQEHSCLWIQWKERTRRATVSRAAKGTTDVAQNTFTSTVTSQTGLQGAGFRDGLLSSGFLCSKHLVVSLEFNLRGFFKTHGSAIFIIFTLIFTKISNNTTLHIKSSDLVSNSLKISKSKHLGSQPLLYCSCLKVAWPCSSFKFVSPPPPPTTDLL